VIIEQFFLLAGDWRAMVGGGFLNQISDLFVVNFDETDSNCVLASIKLSLYFKQLAHRLKHNPWLFCIAEHRVGFACSRRSISENRAIESVHDGST
jgi:hypothetical protein